MLDMLLHTYIGEPLCFFHTSPVSIDEIKFRYSNQRFFPTLDWISKKNSKNYQKKIRFLLNILIKDKYDEYTHFVLENFHSIQRFYWVWQTDKITYSKIIPIR